MKIIKSAKDKKPEEVQTECTCGCVFQFASTEAKFKADWRDGDAYIVKCPECKTENWVAASLFR